MSNVYDQHRAAFANVSAYVILENGEHVGTVAFKYPRDGAGRLYCYFHAYGTQMVRGYAGGGGYDKHSAAAQSAASRIDISDATQTPRIWPRLEKLRAAIKDQGHHWDHDLREAGFTVVQAV